MEYPEFFHENLQRVIDAYNEAKAKINNYASFLFITDVHIHLNGRASVPLMLEIGAKTDVDTVLCGGDHCWAFGSKAQCIADFEDSLRYMDPVRDSMKLFHARGNHDATVRSSWELNTGYTMPYEQVQKMFSLHSSEPTGKVEGKLYYFSDDEASKIRYVVMDTCEQHLDEDSAWGVLYGVSQEQLRWLSDVALCLPGEDWSAVVLGHVPCTPEIPSYHEKMDDLRLVLEAFCHKKECAFADFRNPQGELIAYLCGHNHKDRAAVVNGLLHISTGCDSYCKDDDLPRDVGTTNNTLFDLFLVDKDRKTVQVFRIGAGENREFNY